MVPFAFPVFSVEVRFDHKRRTNATSEEFSNNKPFSMIFIVVIIVVFHAKHVYV